MPRRPKNAELLAALAPVLRRRRLRWYLFGAQAVVVHGRPRFTEDVDVTVAVDDRRLPALIAALGKAGFAARIEEPLAFAVRTRVVPLLHRKTGLPLDLVLAGAGLETEFLERAVLVDIGGVRVPVLAPEDLIVTKIVAGRPKDLDDAEGVLAAQEGSIDLQRIRAALATLDEALGDTDFVARFNRLLHS